MKRRTLMLTPLALLGAQQHNYRYDKTFPLTPQVLDVEIPNGNIQLKLTSSSQLRVAADIQLTAPTPEDLELAKREVRFEPRLESSTFRVSVDAPEQRRWQRYNYRHNVEVEAPASTRLLLRGINGNIDLTCLAQPTKDLYVKNINGQIQLAFPAPPNADFEIKTLNGHIYSQWDMAPLADKSETKVTDNGIKRIVSRNRFAGGRLGRGGIQILIEGLNGDIRITERKA